MLLFLQVREFPDLLSLEIDDRYQYRKEKDGKKMEKRMRRLAGGCESERFMRMETVCMLAREVYETLQYVFLETLEKESFFWEYLDEIEYLAMKENCEDAMRYIASLSKLADTVDQTAKWKVYLLNCLPAECMELFVFDFVAQYNSQIMDDNDDEE